MNHSCPIALIILDGWGYSPEHKYNAIFQAYPATFNMLLEKYPYAFLEASGKAVGLPEGTPGNSEVGHITMGAGEIIQEPLTIINNAINDGSFFSHPALLDILETCKNKNGRLHFLGLLSEGSVHSSSHHLFALLRAAVENKIPSIFIHVFLDGRDVAPESAKKYIRELENVIERYGQHASSVVIGSISGRLYAMDRDNNWERTERTYAMLTARSDVYNDCRSWSEILEENYKKNISDEFIEPILLYPEARIQDNDTLFFFNIRPDRMRQLVSLFARLSSSQNNHPANLTIASMVPYNDNTTIPFLYKKKQPQETLLDVLEALGLNIFTIAETEKYAHITYFFNGGKETIRPKETRMLISSHKNENSYIDDPEMSAPEITKAVLDSLKYNPCDFYLINYANADMVGHSGNIESTIKAIVCLDMQLKLLYEEFVEKRNGIIFITSDHGNAEEKWDSKNNCPKKSHTTNKVPFIMVQKKIRSKHRMLSLTQLSDIKNFIVNIIKVLKNPI